MIVKILSGVVGVSLIAVWLLWAQVEALQEDKAVLSANNTQLSQAVSEVESELQIALAEQKRLNNIILKNKNEKIILKKERDEAEQKYLALVENDDEVESWHNTKLPTALRGGMLESPEDSGENED